MSEQTSTLVKHPLEGTIEPASDTVLLGDGVALLKKVPSNSVHLILSDIPYGIGLDEWDILHSNTNSAYMGSSPAQLKAGKIFRRRGKPINGWSEADKKIPYEYYKWCMTWAPEWARILKPGGSVFVFAGRRFAHRCILALEESGLNYRDMLSWVRPRAVYRAQRLSVVYQRRNNVSAAERWKGWRIGNLRPIFEPIIWCFKPYKLTIADNVIEHEVGAFNQDAFNEYFGSPDNCFRCDMEPGEGGLHPAQKPMKLFEALIELVTLPGQVVVDPFAGSGTSGLAARRLNRRFLMFENDREIYEAVKKRLADPLQEKLI